MTDLQRILRDLQRNAKAMDSHTLANIVQKSLLRGLRSSRRDVRDLGAKGNLFYVLMGANMPSILVEVSFITNPVEEKLLKSPAYREKIARGIASGISEYLGELDSPGLVARQ
jgi:N-acetylmuramoyl-L-alanine amidase